ncbi:phosphopyruvate hydratase [Ureaplasma miroungigenitalium]|uniref:phosphopyruvate hydratase n=1 Tax=Ureaplasma miroungigenitalium TaxID=1042321 RepID=UPI0021E96F5A|nr:phosphopyruvate hydratase [Ureaplasma miroungigenitalium]MCV3734219.1 phosphopyruvate hydratase [Ureaplasma miroungigenitalium]
MYIKNILAYQILDSRGYPTVAVRFRLSDNTYIHAKIPSGASTGSKEALELRDNNPKYFANKSVLKAIRNIKEHLAPLLLNRELKNFFELDELLVKSDNVQKEKYGANAILACSIALVKACAHAHQKPVYQYIKEDLMNNSDPYYYAPIPMMNFINGGAHADNDLSIQEFMIMPVGAHDFAHAIQTGAEIFYELQKILKEHRLNTNKGDEGGFAPQLSTDKQALDLIVQAILQAGYSLTKQCDLTKSLGKNLNQNNVGLALDVAASEFFDHKSNQYRMRIANEDHCLNTNELAKHLMHLAKQYPIISIEDPFDENDWTGFIQLTKQNFAQIVGDDLYTTNMKYLQLGIDQQASHAILIKPNQIGSISETLATIQLAQKMGMRIIISHRSGETEDDFIADLAIGVSAEMIKTGSLSRSERIAKYNRILEIQAELQTQLIYTPHKKF